MEIISELQMRNETVRLDGRHFIDCTFTSCILEYGGSEVILERTAFNDCRHVFFDHALMTWQLMRVLGISTESTLTAPSVSPPMLC